MSQATALTANAIQHQSSTLTAVSIAGYYPLFSVSNCQNFQGASNDMIMTLAYLTLWTN